MELLARPSRGPLTPFALQNMTLAIPWGPLEGDFFPGLMLWGSEPQ
jgi:hypothetical protein